MREIKQITRRSVCPQPGKSSAPGEPIRAPGVSPLPRATDAGIPSQRVVPRNAASRVPSQSPGFQRSQGLRTPHPSSCPLHACLCRSGTIVWLTFVPACLPTAPLPTRLFRVMNTSGSQARPFTSRRGLPPGMLLPSPSHCHSLIASRQQIPEGFFASATSVEVQPLDVLRFV